VGSEGLGDGPEGADEPQYRFDAERRKMVDEQIRARGVRDPRVLEAMERLPRHLFVDESLEAQAYLDSPLPTEAGQTISQPYIVGRMLELAAIEPDHRVLEIGTGSGYQTALLARLARQVYSVERVARLLEQARARLELLGCDTVALHEGDGTLGWQDFAPYDRVVVAAAAPRVPDALKAQLGERGVLVIPVGGPRFQHLETWRRLPRDQWEHRRHGECRFVPLLGRDGWREEPEESEEHDVGA
jgi:protein-L-isoaspartate(D-aspartate) O-methyltransferase